MSRSNTPPPDSIPPGLLVGALAPELARALVRVSTCFDEALHSDLPAVAQLVSHIEHYRGKMLRPALVLLSGLAAHPRGDDAAFDDVITDRHIRAAAVCEMVHMATLVHDDVLDEADTRRRGRTVNRLHGNETAVILGDFLFSRAFWLCSTIDAATSLAVADAASTTCVGELVQLHHRNVLSIDEPTYFEIVTRKTAALIAVSCEVGAAQSSTDTDVRRAMGAYGRAVGIAFQIQDDLLDLLGDRMTVGKPVGQDAGRGKLTLPVIHHLATADSVGRGSTLRLLDDGPDGPDDAFFLADLRAALELTGSIQYARSRAHEIVASGKRAIEVLPRSPARDALMSMADATIARSV